MQKISLIREVSEKTGITQEDVNTIITATLETIKQNVRDGKEIVLNDFGRFKQHHVPQKIGRRLRGKLQSIEPVIIPPRTIAKFKPSKKFVI